MNKDRSSREAKWLRRRRGKIGEYKEDCTDGKFSVLNPITFKGDALIQVWLDSRELATISEWLDNNGYRTRFMSEVVKEGLHILCEDLVEDGEVEMIEDTVEARRIIEDKYRICLNPKTARSQQSIEYKDTRRRGEKNLLHNIILSERKKEAVPDSLREMQKKAKETYTKLEREGMFKSGGSIFDELVEMEKGENHANTIESKDE